MCRFVYIYGQRQYGRNHVTERIKIRIEQNIQICGMNRDVIWMNNVTRYQQWCNYERKTSSVRSPNQSAGYITRPLKYYLESHETEEYRKRRTLDQFNCLNANFQFNACTYVVEGHVTKAVSTDINYWVQSHHSSNTRDAVWWSASYILWKENLRIYIFYSYYAPSIEY